MFKNAKFFLLAGTLFLQGCFSTLWVAWIGYKHPTPDSFISVDGCGFKIGVQNLDPFHELQIVKESAKKICETLSDKGFEEMIKNKEWIASCGRGGQSTNNLISGAELIELLQQPINNFSIYINRPSFATAQADPINNRIAITPNRVSSWQAGNKAPFYTSMSHEMLHLISVQFKDRGHHPQRCPQSKLVSYRVSEIISEMIISKNLAN